MNHNYMKNNLLKINIIIIIIFFCITCFKIKKGLSFNFDGKFNYQSRTKLNQGELENNAENFHSFNTKFHLENSFSENTKGIFSFSAEKPLYKDFLMYEIPEAYISSEFSNSNLKIGRTILNWSNLDSLWKLGLLNLRKHFSVVDPSQVGLNVINYNWGYNAFKMSLIGSYFYIPERYPSLTVEDDGKLGCNSTYCNKYWDYAYFPGADKFAPLVFEKENQSISEIVFKKTYGINFELGGDNHTFNMFYLYKPENIYRTYGESKVHMDGNFIHVKFRGEFFDHHIFGGDYRVNLVENLDFVTSAITVIPENNKEIHSDLENINTINQSKNRNSLINIGFDHEFKRGQVRLHYLKELTSSAPLDDSLPTKLPWTNAFNLMFERSLGRKWRSLLDLKINTTFSEAVLAWEARYFFAKKFVVGLGMQVIHSSKDDSYWASYRDQDMAFTNLTYYF